MSLISLLVGLILAFIGAIQLKTFGAQIYVADLVGIAMVRVMGAIMTGIIMAGRTGAAYAAQLGTMQVNEEIDALKTLGHIAHGISRAAPHVGPGPDDAPALRLRGHHGHPWWIDRRCHHARSQPYRVPQSDKGVFHADQHVDRPLYSAVFGVIIALSGCLRGMQCGRSASAVGDATTSAVVTGIVSIIVATAIITMHVQRAGDIERVASGQVPEQ